MLQRSGARKKKQGAVAQPHEEDGDGSCRGCRCLLRGACYSAAPSSSWSCTTAQFRVVRGATLQRDSELFMELRCNVAPSSAQL